MVNPANRDDELVAHAAPECTGLCKGEVMGIRWYAAAHEARLPQHESPVILIAQGVFPKARMVSPRDCFLVARTGPFWRASASDARDTSVWSGTA